MKFGHFDDERREYVIDTPYTPLPWINYLGNDDFFSIISNTAGGYSFYRDAKLRRITRYRYNSPATDNGGRYYYITDKKTVFSPAFLPVGTPLDYYKCRHGLNYTVFESRKNDVYAELTCFVPLSDDCEVNILKIRNDSDAPKTLSVYGGVEFCLWNAQDDATNFQRNYNTGEVEIATGKKYGAIYHKTEYRERRDHYAFYSLNDEINGYDTDRDTFLGKFNGFDAPDAVSKATSFNEKASGWAPVAFLRKDLTLAPGEERSLVCLLGYVENAEDEKWEAPGIINKKKAVALIEKYASEQAALKELDKLHAAWDKLLDKFTVKTSDEKFDRMVNIWNQYQCLITYRMSRSASYYESGIGRGMGFRDSCQDLLGFAHILPEKARERIIDIASIQLSDGSTWHQYQPLTKRGNADVGGGFNDDPLWLVACVYAYVCETGDSDILNASVPFNNDENDRATLMEHLKRSVDFTVTHKGPHGLPLIGRADWNDCLNLNCFSKNPGESFQTCSNYESGKAESVFIAGMFVKYGEEYARLCDMINDKAEAARIRKEVAIMTRTAETSGWDGEWFVRAYDAFEKPVGSKTCDDGKIFIEPQGMCVMAGIGVNDGKAQTALDSVKKYLDTKYGIVLLQPAYKEYHLNLGEVSSYPCGYKENAGIFCHNNPWVSCAEATLGNGERAFEIYRKICPAYLEDISEIHKTEPYVFSQMIAGKDAPDFGSAKNSWLTGTAAWTFVNASQYILGVTPTLSGLVISPCMPYHINEFTLTRIYRGVKYEIHAKRGEEKDAGVYVDGKKCDGGLLPRGNVGETIKAEVVFK